MMKKYVLLIVAIAMVFNLQAQQQQDFVIKGKFTGTDTKTLKLSYVNSDGKFIQDSAIIVNGQFEFKGVLSEPTMARIAGKVKGLSMDDPNFSNIFLSPGILNLALTEEKFKQLKLTGSKMQDEHITVEKLKAPIGQESESILLALIKANEAYVKAKQENRPIEVTDSLRDRAAEAREKLAPFNAKRTKIDLDFISKNPDSYYAAYLLMYNISGMNIVDAQKFYENLTPKIKESSYGKQLMAAVKKIQAGSPGSIAADFTAKDLQGQNLSLADFRGQKYVIIDFWASWCVPCRKGNPHLIKLFNTYKGKGLDIIGVSDDDRNLQAWKTAVEQDKIGIWYHVLRGLDTDLTRKNLPNPTDISKKYGISSLPTKILIDKNGMIIGRYGGGGESDDDLDKKLAEIFK